MHFELFSDTLVKVEGAVNESLAEQSPAPVVRASETRIHEHMRPGGLILPTITVGLWYDLPAPPQVARRAQPKAKSGARTKAARR